MLEEISYKVYKDKCEFIIEEKIYNIKTLMKAAYIYIDKLYILFESIGKNKIKIIFKGKEKLSDETYEKYVGRFINELLHQKIRENISKDTKNIREMILARALYGTAIYNEKIKLDEENYEDIKNAREEEYEEDKDDIAISWFQKNEDV